MSILLISLAVLVVISFVAAYVKCQEMVIGFELNLLNSPFYKIGIFSERFVLQDNQIEDELTIGLFFVNITFTFWREEEDFQA